MAEKRRRLLAAIVLSGALSASAQTNAPTTVLLGTPPQPGWSLLSTQQKIILAPLAKDWDNMEYVRRRKWLGIADRFPKMSPSEQARVQQRMREWASLSPEQRTKIRDSYKEFNQLPAEKRQAVKQKWETYSNLPDEEKQRVRQAGKSTATPLPTPAPPVEPPTAKSEGAKSE